MDKYFQVMVLSIILSVIFLGIIFMLFLRLKRILDGKQKEFEKMLNNEETKNQALLILNKRKNRSEKAMVFSKYYLLFSGLLCISLGIYMFCLETIPNENYSIKIIKCILTVIIGLYFLFTSLRQIVGEYINKKNNEN
jgi:heme/copper-type cytochrome/quinol oxidase subunit 3